jgi:hypothetical protein
VFGGKTPSATNVSKNAVVAVDLPHGTGSASCAINSTKGGWRKDSNKGKGALTPLLPLLLLASRLWASDEGEAEKAGEAKTNGKVSRTDPFTSPFYHCAGWILRSDPKPAALNAVDFAVADSWAPRL